MKISIVIPNFNGESLLKKNLPRVIESISSWENQIEFIITDDCSQDDSLNIAGEFLASIKKDNFSFKILKNEKNLGFSANVNKGVAEATGEILILLNTDIIPEKGFLEPLLSGLKDENVFAVGCMDKSIEDGKIVTRGRGIGEWKKGLLIHSKGENNKSNTLWVSCGSGAFKSEIWKKLGGLDNLYNPFYWEDIDLSYRALKSGYKILFENRSVVLHEHEKGAIKSKYSAFKVKTVAYRNQFIFAWKNATDFTLRLSELIYMPYHLLRALLRLDIAFFIGFFNALILLPKILKSSLTSKKFFVKKDKEVTKEFIQ
jgi:GT2 family glycosyltransferase